MKPAIIRILVPTIALAAASALSACGGGGTVVPPGAQPLAAQGRSADPDKCNKKSTQAINPSGGMLTLPPCASYTGDISYGKSGAPAKTTVTLVTTTKNPGGVPTPKGKTTLAYVIATGNSSDGSVTFQTATQNSTIANPALQSTKTYALYAYALGVTVKGFPQQIGSPKSGVLTFKSPLNGETVPEGIPVDFELVQN